MCLSPLSIPNPNYGKTGFWYQFKDTSSQMIRIPCGYCAECIALKQMYLVQRVQMEALNREFFFCTLTYDNKHLPSVITSSGYSIDFADIEHVQLLVKRMRNVEFPSLRFLAVSEFGSQKGRPHFHILFSVPRSECPDYGACLNMEYRLYKYVFEHWSVNVGSRRSPVYEPLFEYHEKFSHGRLYKNFDLHYVTPALSSSGSVADVAFYVLKYMMKSSPREIRLQQALRLNLPEDEYETIWSMVRPRCLKSAGFGIDPVFSRSDSGSRVMSPSPKIVSYIRDSVSRSDKSLGYPCFYAPDNGMRFPLAMFYRDKPAFYSVQDALDFYYHSQDSLPELKSGHECYNTMIEYEKKIVTADSHSSDCYFDF